MQSFSNEFVDSARAALAFLESEHGFRDVSITTPDDTTSVYATYVMTCSQRSDGSSNLYVRLIFTPARGELFLECSRDDVTDVNRTFDVRELLAIEARDSTIEFTHAVSDAIGRPGIMRKQFDVLAEILQTHGHRFFHRDDSLWDDVARYRSRQP